MDDRPHQVSQLASLLADGLYAETQLYTVYQHIATELHQLAVVNAAFHGLCLVNPSGTVDGAVGPLGPASNRAHLPLHCNVAERLWALACGAEDWSQSAAF
eukprot:scaffold75644_cov44-Prasinocladus_malaysianus.AAC.1